MKNSLIRPILVFTLLAMALVACGKKNNADTGVIPPGGPVVIAPPITPPPVGTDPAYWCAAKGGRFSYHHNLCRISRYQNFGWNRYWGSIDTGIMVYTNDRVLVEVGGDPKIYVGGYNYGRNYNFVSQVSGTIVVKDSIHDSFKIKSVEIQRCYGINGVSAVCP
jgi:hypothetical protein